MKKQLSKVSTPFQLLVFEEPVSRVDPLGVGQAFK